jgi:hypothetical protein
MNDPATASAMSGKTKGGGYLIFVWSGALPSE